MAFEARRSSLPSSACSPRERLKKFLFFTGQCEGGDPAALHRLIDEVVQTSIEEFKSLVTLLLPDSYQDILTPVFMEALRLDEVNAFHGVPILHIGLLMDAYELLPSTSTYPHPLATQFLADGLYAWLKSQPEPRLQRMSIACGLDPSQFAEAYKSEKGIEQILDFLVSGVIFPQEEQEVDWLACVEPSSVAEKETSNAADETLKAAAASASVFTQPPQSSPHPVAEPALNAEDHKRKREGEGEEAEADEGDIVDITELRQCGSSEALLLKKQQQEREDEDAGLITPSNLRRYMAEDPRKLPFSVIAQARRSIANGITAFELENHYRAEELRAYVQAHRLVARANRKHDMAVAILEQLAAQGSEVRENEPPAQPAS